MLHIVSHLPQQNSPFALILPTLTRADAVVLLGDGLYWDIDPKQATLYAIDQHRSTRGLDPKPGVQYIDEAQLVELSTIHFPAATW